MGRGVRGIVKGELVLEAPGKYGNRQPQEDKGEPGQVRTDFVRDAHSHRSSYQSSVWKLHSQTQSSRDGWKSELSKLADQLVF
jgi:hypothetical protein